MKEEEFIKLKLVSIKNIDIRKYILKIKTVKFLPLDFYTLLDKNNIIFNDIVLYTNKKLFSLDELEAAIIECDRLLLNHPKIFDNYIDMKDYIESNFDISIITAWKNTIDLNSRDFKLMNLNDIIGNYTSDIDISEDMKKNIKRFNVSLLLFTNKEDITSIANKLYIQNVLNNMGLLTNFTLDEITVFLSVDIKSFYKTVNFFNLNDIK